MAANTLNFIKERNRQRLSDDSDFLGTPLFFFELRLPQELLGVASTPVILFPLVVGPNSYSLEEPFTVEATATQGGGLVVEENGIIQRTIKLSGTTGFKPRKLNSPSFTSGNGLKALQALSPEKRSYGRKLKPQILEALSGQRHFQYLQDAIFRTYADLKRDPAYSAETELYFHNPKDDEHWRVAPQRFVLERDVSKTVLYNYNIELLVMDKADAVAADFSEDKLWIDAVKDPIRMVKSGLDLMSGALNDLTALTGELTGVVKDFSKIIDASTTIVAAATNFVEGVTAGIESPYAIIESISRLTESGLTFSNTYGDLRKNTPESVIQKLRKLQDGAWRIGTHPESFEVSVQSRNRDYKKRQELLTQMSTATRTATLSSSPPTTFDDVNALGTGSTAGDVVSARSELGAGQDVQQYTGAREIAVGQGDTLVNLSAKYLGDARLWQHIAILNGLRSPFITAQSGSLLVSDESPFPSALSIGDTILIPNFARPPAQQPQLPVLGVRLSESAENQFLGTDLSMVDVGEIPGSPLFDIPIDVEAGSTDAATVSGLSNMTQAVVLRLSTEQGTDPLYRNIGMPRIVGLNRKLFDLQTAKFRLIQTLESDGRVSSVSDISFSETGEDSLTSDVTLELQGFSDSANIQMKL